MASASASVKPFGRVLFQLPLLDRHAEDYFDDRQIFLADGSRRKALLMAQVVAPVGYVLRRDAPGVIMPQIVDQAFYLVAEVAHGARRFAIGQVVVLPQLENGAD